MITYTKLGKEDIGGRLGNGLFEIASTIGIAKANNTEFVFPPWKYEQNFNLHNCFSSNIKPTRVYTEPFYHFQMPIINNDGITDLSGFFQSYKYFEHCESYIKFVFESIYQEKTLNGVTSIHVRLRDYLTLGNMYYITLANTDYYERAMEILGSDCYYIFSDDINWCKQRFKGDKFVFIEEQDPCVSLSKMSACEHNVLANSSFSWWGAYLNKNTNKKIIAPQNWFGPKLPHNTSDLIPPSWQRI